VSEVAVLAVADGIVVAVVVPVVPALACSVLVSPPPHARAPTSAVTSPRVPVRKSAMSSYITGPALAPAGLRLGSGNPASNAGLWGLGSLHNSPPCRPA